MPVNLSLATLVVPAATLLLAAPSSAQEGPHMRSGLWETTVKEMGKTMSMTQCITDQSQKAYSVFSSQVRKNGQCTAQTHTHNVDGSWTGVSTCTFVPGSPPRTSRVDLVGDFNTSYTMTMRSPPTAAPSVIMLSRYLGPCPPGQRGGDFTVNGRTMNMVDRMGKN